MPCVFTATQLAHHYKTNVLGSQECEQSLYHISCSLKEYFLYQRTWTFFRSHVHISWIIKSMGTNSSAYECSTTAFSHISGCMNFLQISWILSCQGHIPKVACLCVFLYGFVTHFLHLALIMNKTQCPPVHFNSFFTYLQDLTLAGNKFQSHQFSFNGLDQHFFFSQRLWLLKSSSLFIHTLQPSTSIGIQKNQSKVCKQLLLVPETVLKCCTKILDTKF